MRSKKENDNCNCRFLKSDKCLLVIYNCNFYFQNIDFKKDNVNDYVVFSIASTLLIQ